MEFGKFKINNLVALIIVFALSVVSIEVLNYLAMGCAG